MPIDIFAGDTLTDAYAAINPLRETPVLELDTGEQLASPPRSCGPRRGHAVPARGPPRARAVAQWLSFEQERIMGGLGNPRFRLLTGREARASSGAAGDGPRGAGRARRTPRGARVRRRRARRRSPISGSSRTSASPATRARVPPQVDAWLERVRALPGFVDDYITYPDNARPGRTLDLRPSPACRDPTISVGRRTKAFERWLNTFYDLVEGDEELARDVRRAVSEEHAPRHDMVVRGDGRARRLHDTTAATSTCWPSTAASPSRRAAPAFVTLLSRAADDAGLPGRPGVPRRADGLRGVGDAARGAQLAARRRGRRAGPGAALGLGRGAA